MLTNTACSCTWAPVCVLRTCTWLFYVTSCNAVGQFFSCTKPYPGGNVLNDLAHICNIVHFTSSHTRTYSSFTSCYTCRDGYACYNWSTRDTWSPHSTHTHTYTPIFKTRNVQSEADICLARISNPHQRFSILKLSYVACMHRICMLPTYFYIKLVWQMKQDRCNIVIFL